MRRKLLAFLFRSTLLLGACGQESPNIESENDLESELELANQQIDSLERQLNEANEKASLENTGVEATEEVDGQVESSVEYRMGEINGYYRVNAPNEIGVYIDQSMIVKSVDGIPTVYPITDYEFYENKLMVDMLDIDFEKDYIEKITNIYTIYDQNDSKSIRKSLNPTQENARFHYEEVEIPKYIKEKIDYDQYCEQYLKWEKEQVR